MEGRKEKENAELNKSYNLMYAQMKSALYKILGTKTMMRMKDAKVNLPFYVRMRPLGKYNPGMFFFVFSPYTEHPGLSDRLKPLVTCYNFAKRFGCQFRIVFKYPFALEDYLVPNKVNWVADYGDLHYSIGHTSFFSERKILTEDSWKKVCLKPDREYHCYNYAGNWQPEVYPDTGYSWYDLYSELFKPGEKLQERLDACPFKPKTYIAVHIRFVNALDNFEKATCYDNPLQSEEQKRELIGRCKKGIMDIKRMNGDSEILVFSDSKRFLQSLDDIPVHTLTGGVMQSPTFLFQISGRPS